MGVKKKEQGRENKHEGRKKELAWRRVDNKHEGREKKIYSRRASKHLVK